MMTPLPKNLAMTNARLGIFNAGTRFERTGKNAPVTLLTLCISRGGRRRGEDVPNVLVARIVNNAPTCNPMLNCAAGSRPPPPHMGFAVTANDDDDDEVVLSATCRATSCIISAAGIVDMNNRQTRRCQRQEKRELTRCPLLLRRRWPYLSIPL
jgi:hypothetical protein